MTPPTYAAHIEEIEPGEWLASFAEIPEALTSGLTREAAIEAASDALAVALEGYRQEGLEPPHARPAEPGEVDIVARHVEADK